MGWEKYNMRKKWYETGNAVNVDYKTAKKKNIVCIFFFSKELLASKHSITTTNNAVIKALSCFGIATIGYGSVYHFLMWC